MSGFHIRSEHADQNTTSADRRGLIGSRRHSNLAQATALGSCSFLILGVLPNIVLEGLVVFLIFSSNF